MALCASADAIPGECDGILGLSIVCSGVRCNDNEQLVGGHLFARDAELIGDGVRGKYRGENETMLIDWGPIVLSLIAAGISVMGLLLQRRKDNAGVAETYEAMAARQAGEIDKLRKEIHELKRDLQFRDSLIEQRDAKIEEWAAGIDLLVHQLVANGIKPTWRPRIVPKMEGRTE